MNKAAQILSLLAGLSAVANAVDYTAEALADQVTNLPGAEGLDIKFNQFSGFIKVNGTKNLHYWFVESMKDPVADPLAFWTNGGPGCSGLLGALTEQGPFRTESEDLTLSLNPSAWNNIANMVFIEAPVGVGFSYSDEPDGDDYTMDDEETAQDNYEMIQGFLKRFPHLKTNELYITSESYGGHYMPTLAREIVDQNTAGNNEVLNFKGFFLGNPATTIHSTIPAGLETYWGHQVVSKPTWDAYTEECQTIKDVSLSL
jgi:carboxypeptidase C (cathepsin A)